MQKKYFFFDKKKRCKQCACTAFFMRLSVEESWLLVLDAKFAVNSCDDTLNLSHSEHTAKERVT